MTAVVIAPTTSPSPDHTAPVAPASGAPVRLSVVASAPGAVRLRSAVYWRCRAVVALLALALAVGAVQLVGRAVDAVSVWRAGAGAGAPAHDTDPPGGPSSSGPVAPESMPE